MHSINRMKMEALTTKGWNDRFYLSRRIRGDLTWWKGQIKLNEARLFQKKTPKYCLTTDACETGLGVMLKEIQKRMEPILAWGTWKGVLNLKSSNQRELCAVMISMRHFSQLLQEEEALCIRTENTVTEFCLRRWRTKGEMLPLLRKERRLVTQLGIKVQTEHIPGIHNQITNSLGNMEVSGDCKLNPAVFQIACQKLQIFPTLDSFAN
ncbi:MAG: hypothetical protein EZS28_051580 [Streblomastix strix]|uniref:Reverse transcriptase RNase H-like domain-containing protein n=1 Tax=Streblomastix strix TaxID=222440 RepID=A0A5J4T576_9EUKA|nr:MAG: hypothetical protein EZS28_051580 [Streblomastix strix]